MIIVCRPKILPIDKLASADKRAIAVNPANESEKKVVSRSVSGRRGGERRIAVVVARKWPSSGVRLSVSFMDTKSVALRKRILSHMNAWSDSANVEFVETQGIGEVRIARLDTPDDMKGYWSYLGTEILEAADDEPTMNLEGFSMGISDAEYRRVVRHEAGHTLGFDHEHMRSDIVQRIDRKKAFAYFKRTEDWTQKETEEQVLTPLARQSIMGTAESDPLSIMCYQLPGSIMKNGKAVRGGKDINATDAAFAGILYPKPGTAHVPVAKTTGASSAAAAPSTAASPVPAVRAPARMTSHEMNARDTFELVVLADFDAEESTSRKRTTPKYAQVLATYGGARVTSNMRLRAEKGETKTGFGQIIRIHERIKAYTNFDEGTLPDDVEMLEFGRLLFDTLFQGDVRRLYDEARSRQRERLNLVLTSMIPWIAEKPWEFAYDPGRQSFVATEDIHFIRNVLTNIPADATVPVSGPLRILVASAQPIGFGKLSIDQEVAVIRRGFQPLIDAGLVSIDVLARATPPAIHGYLSTGSYQVVHFIGHGEYDLERNEGCLTFVDERDREYSLGSRAIREIFCGRGLSMVFLNACQSGAGGRADFNKGVAQSLVAHGLPALVANQYSVLDSSATTFAQHFYWSIAQGMTLAESAREARIAVNYSLSGDPIDWAVPVLYARDGNATLCSSPDTAVRMPTVGVRATARRRTAGHSERIAVWDVDRVFPQLDETLDILNHAQSVFGFELADLSVPLGVWDYEEDPETPYLSAERLAARLKTKPMDLSVELLVCVTRHWLRNADWLNLYAWWPDDRKTPITIFSVAGFDDLPAEGPVTNRAITNAIVTGLAGYYGKLDSHAGGVRKCPLAFNEKRDFGHLTGELKFDAGCRRKLKPIGAKLAALDALLEAT